MSSRIVCRTKASKEEKSGLVYVKVNEEFGASSQMFSYQVQDISHYTVTDYYLKVLIVLYWYSVLVITPKGNIRMMNRVSFWLLGSREHGKLQLA